MSSASVRLGCEEDAGCDMPWLLLACKETERACSPASGHSLN
jgi:hypothetical protein